MLELALFSFVFKVVFCFDFEFEIASLFGYKILGLTT